MPDLTPTIDPYVQGRGAPLGSREYYSLRFLAPEVRDDLTAVHAFGREVAGLVEECTEPTVARAKLAWWEHEVHGLRSGYGQHPVSRALGRVLQRHPLAPERFQEMFNAARDELDTPRYRDFPQLHRHCARLGGTLSLMAAEVLGYEDARTPVYARDLGIALQLTDRLRDLGRDLRRGRLGLPLDELAGAGLEESELLANPCSAALRTLLETQTERAVQHLQHAVGKLPAVDRWRQLPGVIQGRLSLMLLEEMQRDGYRMLERRVELTPLRMLWAAGRIARRERRRQRRR
ncbi:MAG: squalene/phytoene synthase family protein [Gammaproteobacteria bacterium]